MLDTNLFVSGSIVSVGYPARALDAWLAGLYTLVTSADLVDEVRDVPDRASLRPRLRLGSRRVEQLLAGLEARASWVTPPPIEELPVHCRDPKDDKFLACALGGAADYLITGDDDLLELDGDERLGKQRILRVRDFLERLSPGQDRPP